jgi:hypothetical protein
LATQSENDGTSRRGAGKLAGGIADGERMYAWPVNRAGPKGTWRRGVLVVTVRLDGLPTVREFYVSRFDGHTPGPADEVSVSAWGQRVVVPQVKRPSQRAAPIVLPRRAVRLASEPGAILATEIDDGASYPFREAMQQTKGRRAPAHRRLPRAPTVRKAFEGPRHGAARSPFRVHNTSP